MSKGLVFRGKNLNDTSAKDDVYDLVDDATVVISDIVNADIKSDAAIVDTKLDTIKTIGKLNLTALTIAGQTAGDILYVNNSGQFTRLPIGTAGQKLKVNINQVDFYEYATDLLAGTNYLSNGTTLATGGTITTDGDYTVHRFLLADSGTNFVSAVSGTVEVLAVGGGGGSTQWDGGGGGGGSVENNTSLIIGAGSYLVTVGDGGTAGGTGSAGNKGGNSVFSTITAYGGGGGGGGYPAPVDATSGGSGGGAGEGWGANRSGAAAGSGSNVNSGGGAVPTWSAGGGGGAGGVGHTGDSQGYGAGDGGDGIGYDTSGSHVHYGGGGGGGNYNGRTGLGVDGGGNGGTNGVGGTAGTSGTGGGAGGGGEGVAGAKGGSGVVYIRYLTTSQSALSAHTESTLKTQGTYSLKGIALITSSLNKTLTRTVSPTINLTGKDSLKFDIRSSRTGSNIKIGIHDSGGTTTETTPNITSANAWQTVTWDISGVSNANKDDIDSIIITIVNADATNTFYLDNFFVNDGQEILKWVTP